MGHLQVEMRISAKKLLVLYPAVLHVDPASRAQPHIRLTSRVAFYIADVVRQDAMRSGGHFDGGHDGGVDILRGGWAGGCRYCLPADDREHCEVAGGRIKYREQCLAMIGPLCKRYPFWEDFEINSAGIMV